MKSNVNAKIKISSQNERITISVDKSKKRENELVSQDGKSHIYHYISSVKKNGQPDILYNSQIIKGINYKLNEFPDSNPDLSPLMNTEAANFSPLDEPMHSAEEEEDFSLKTLKLRYYNVNSISNWCTKCNKGGHLAVSCDKERNKDNFCYRCLSKEHTIESCNNIKCFRCNKFGHRKQECKSSLDIKCHRCNANGHYQNECIRFPIMKDNISLTNCLTFQNRKSFSPELTNIRKIFILDEQNLEEKIIRNLFSNPSCPQCAGKHRIDQCLKLHKNQKDRHNFRR